MPVIEMRESLGVKDLVVPFDADANNVAVVQKRINLKTGTFQRNMVQMDLFFDDFPHVIIPGSTDPSAFPGIIEFYVTPTPLMLTNQTVQLCKKAGPRAANDNILFKATTDLPSSSSPDPSRIRRFPQDFLATNANFPFFHDTLYLTIVFHANQDVRDDLVVRFLCSFYMSYNEKKVSSLRAACGVLSERFNSYVALLERNGRSLNRPLALQGEFIPSYAWGGIRPELMVDGTTLSRFFLKQDAQQPEPMQSSNSLRSFARFARQMVPNPEAFGTLSGAQGGIPDWFSSMLPKGVTAGPVRAQFPPRVTQDDPAQNGLGNILMV